MLPVPKRAISNGLRVIRPVTWCLDESMVSAPIKNLDMLLAPASPDLGTLRDRSLLSGYLLDQSGHLNPLRDQTCSSLMHRGQKRAAVIVNCCNLFHVDFDLFGR